MWCLILHICFGRSSATLRWSKDTTDDNSPRSKKCDSFIHILQKQWNESGFSNYLFICMWDCFVCFSDFGLGFFFVCFFWFGFVRRSLLPNKNLIFVKYWVHHLMFWSLVAIASCNTAVVIRSKLGQWCCSIQNRNEDNLANKMVYVEMKCICVSSM